MDSQYFCFLKTLNYDSKSNPQTTILAIIGSQLMHNLKRKKGASWQGGLQPWLWIKMTTVLNSTFAIIFSFFH